jgi:pancreatic triacylglycerol lipase
MSGLDPAEPLFQDMPTFVRLDPTDADFVDVIHTDSKSIMMGGQFQILNTSVQQMLCNDKR